MNLIEPGDRVLVLSNGYWGDLFGTIIEAHGGETVVVREGRRPLKPEKIAEVLDTQSNVKAVTCIHAETNNGILNPIEKIGRIVKDHGAIFIVDTARKAGKPAFTLPSSLIYALHEAVTEILETGLDRFYKQRETAGRAFRAGLRAAGV